MNGYAKVRESVAIGIGSERSVANPRSRAVDIAPWNPVPPHIRWNNEREFVFLAGRMVQAARSIGVKLRWGGDWDMDNDLYDLNKPFDLGHFELF